MTKSTSPSFVFISTFIVISQWFLSNSSSFIIPSKIIPSTFLATSTCSSTHKRRRISLLLLSNKRHHSLSSSTTTTISTLLRATDDGSNENQIIQENINSDLEDDDHSLDEETILRFQGVGRLYEQTTKAPLTYTQILTKLQKSTIAIIGIGGVGSWIAESICRSGINNIILVDLDDVCISNTNRQLHATSSKIGQMKINVMKERLLDINPNVNVTCIHEFITQENVFDIVENKFRLEYNVDVIIDAIDGNTEKAALIAACCVKDVPIITCGGAAGRMDPTQIICQDLSTSVECKLLFWTKKKLRNEYRLFPNDIDTTSTTGKKKKKKKMKKWRIPAIYSLETQKKLENEKDNDDASSSSFRKCDGGLGTACFVTGTYGMIAASQAIKMIVNDDFPKPRLIKSSVEYWNQVHEEKKKMKKKEEQELEQQDGSDNMQNDVLEGFFVDLN